MQVHSSIPFCLPFSMSFTKTQAYDFCSSLFIFSRSFKRHMIDVFMPIVECFQKHLPNLRATGMEMQTLELTFFQCAFFQGVFSARCFGWFFSARFLGRFFRARFFRSVILVRFLRRLFQSVFQCAFFQGVLQCTFCREFLLVRVFQGRQEIIAPLQDSNFQLTL